MEGFQGQITTIQIFQNKQEQEKFYRKIMVYEQYKNIVQQKSNYCEIHFDRNYSFTLDLFIKSIERSYLSVYDGQIINLTYKLLEHLIKLQKFGLIHGNIKPENIIITLKEDSDKFTTFARPVYINQIQFINYSLSKNEDYDYKQLKSILIKLFNKIKIKNYIKTMQEQIDNLNLQELFKRFEQFVQIRLNDQIKVKDNEIEDGLTSYRYLRANQYSQYLKLAINQVNQYIQEIETVSPHDQKQLVSQIDEYDTEIIKTKENLTIEDIKKQNEIQIKQQLNSICQQFKTQVINLYKNNFYENAIFETMKDIGEYLISSNFMSSLSLKRSQDAILAYYYNSENQIVNLKEIGQAWIQNIIVQKYNKLIEQMQQDYKFNININITEIAQEFLDEAIYTMLFQNLFDTQIIFNGGSLTELKTEWQKKIDDKIEKICEVEFDLETWKLIQDLI